MIIFYRLILLVLLIIGPSLVHTSAHAAIITCSTLVDDSSTDNTAALNTCLTAASGQVEKTVSIVEDHASKYYKFSSWITVPEGVSIIGATDGIKVAGNFRLSDYSKIINLDFEDYYGRT